MIRLAWLVGVLLALNACAILRPAPIIPVSAQPAAAPIHTVDKNYAIGQEASAFVGEPMIKVKDYWITHADTGAYRLPIPVTYKFRPFGIREAFPAGTPAYLAGYIMDEGVRRRVLVLPGKSARAFPMLVDESGRFTGRLLNMPGGRVPFTAGKGKPITLEMSGEFTFPASTAESVSTEDGYINFEIIYAGSTANSVNLIYREYTPKDLARAAFTQNLTYSKESPIIRFKKIRIDVLSAGNEQIRYVVQSDGSE